MRVLYLGNFKNPWNTENYVAHALRELGHRVERLQEAETISRTEIHRIITQWRPDIFLYAKGRIPQFPKALEEIKDRGVTTVCWLFDLYHEYGSRSQNDPIFRADHVFTTDGCGDWPNNHKTLRQGIHKPHHELIEGEKTHDVAFVGTVYGTYRKQLINNLKKWYGNKFILHTKTRGIDLNAALGRVKVVVGDSYPHDNYWSNRVYEITGRGGFLIHPETRGLEEEFDGLIPTFKRGNWEGLKNQIDLWLNDEDARETMRVTQHKKCGDITYTKRAEELLSHVR